jgi:hypothetical protein
MSNVTTGHKREFFCDCYPQKSLTPAEMKEHLSTKHGITTTKGNKRLICALDGECYNDTFECEIGGIKFTEVSSGPARTH